jgi:hypothetical protein
MITKDIINHEKSLLCYKRFVNDITYKWIKSSVYKIILFNKYY